MNKNTRLWGTALIAIAALQPMIAHADEATKRADATLKAMTPEEKTIITHGIMPLPVGTHPAALPEGAVPGAGYIAGIPRLNIPALTETDASLGVSYVFGLRKDGATAMPSGLAMAATWNPALLRHGGEVIGQETRAKGFNVLLAGGTNLMRDPRNGRTFEYLSEDPLLSGVLVGNAIAGIQSNNIISTIKHFALNGQETGRKFADVKITDAAARESDLLAFQIGIELGNPGSVMCSYNRVNGEQGCASDYLLNKVLKQDWGYKGFVMSDWGAVPNLEAALKGLDQQSGEQLDPAEIGQHYDHGGGERLVDLTIRTGPFGDRYGENPDGLTLEKIKAAAHGVDEVVLGLRDDPVVRRTADAQRRDLGEQRRVRHARHPMRVGGPAGRCGRR